MKAKTTNDNDAELAKLGLKEKDIAHSFELYGKKISIMTDGRLLDRSCGLLFETKKPVLATKKWKEDDTIVEVGGLKIGAKRVIVIAGPCSIESEDQLLEVAMSVKRSGATILRGGAFKPRTSPYQFQGHGEKALRLLKRVGNTLGMPVVSEIVSAGDIDLFMEVGIDIIQVGMRNAQNFELLKAVGKSGVPVLLKRGAGNTVEEWIGAAEYILANGNGNVMLCERGIRTHENSTRYTLDLGGMASASLLTTHLPVGADPSHSAGIRELVAPHALASVAAGADFVIVEVHNDPEKALSDSGQQLNLHQFANMMGHLKRVAEAIDREI